MSEGSKPAGAGAHAALEHWSHALDPSAVETRREALGLYETATFLTHHRVLAALFPSCTEDVRECARIATRFGISLYPLSGGRNWGYGSRVPTAKDCVILDLRRMNRVTGYDETFGTLTVEPGVTFEQVINFLRERDSPFELNSIGGPPDASVLGNVLERGTGYGRYADRFDAARELEVVLPTGECFSTGFGRFGGTKVKGLHRWGLGPYVDGLFTQSNFGVVTRLTFCLIPRPKYLERIQFSCDGEAAFGRAVDSLRELRLDFGVRFMSHASLEPLRARVEGRPIPPLPWTGMILSPSESVLGLLARRVEVLGKLRRLATRVHVEGPLLDARVLSKSRVLAKWGVRPIRSPRVTFAAATHDELISKPEHELMDLAYLLKPDGRPPVPDLDRDRCGLLWCAPALPFDGQSVIEVGRITHEVCAHHLCAPHVSLHAMGWRSIDGVLGIVFDRDDEGADHRALACGHALNARLLSAGYPPRRLGIQSMDDTPDDTDDYGIFHARIKRALDPALVLAPGRYEPSKAHTPS